MINNRTAGRVLKTFLLFCGVIGGLFAVESGSFLLSMADDRSLEQAKVILTHFW